MASKSLEDGSENGLPCEVQQPDSIEHLTTCIQEIDTLSVSENQPETPNEQFENDKQEQCDFSSNIQDEDYRKDTNWLNKEKHIFVMSLAGKPIYSRYGNENKLATLFGVMQAIVSFVQDQNDTIKFVQAGNTKTVFLIKNHLILVAVSRTQENVKQLVLQLNYVFNQIVSILTMTTLNKTYEKRRNFDLRRSLSGVERLIDHLLDFYEKESAFTFGSVQYLSLASSVRDSIGSAIVQACSKIKNVVFGILMANDQFITIVRMKKYFIHANDLHLILNLVHASESLKAAESWTPLCLPHFNEDGYLYSHVSYLAEDCQACLLLLTTDRDVFFALSEAKQKIVEKLRRGNCLEAINESLNTPKETATLAGFPEIRHYIYKMKTPAQFYQPMIGPPYTVEPNRLFMLYKCAQQLLHHGGTPMKLIFEKSPHEAMLAWDTKEFELYIVFEPLIDTAASIATVSRLLNWLKKREDRLFQLNQQLF